MDERRLLDDQIAYYRARAAEYDATSMPDGDPFATPAERIRAALRAFGGQTTSGTASLSSDGTHPFMPRVRFYWSTA